MRGAQGVAYLHVAVADGEYLAFAVDVCYLVYESVVFGFLENSHTLVVGDIMSAVGLHQIFRHVAHADTPVVVVVRAAFVQALAPDTARADSYCQMSLIAFEPVADMLDVSRLVLHRDGFLHGDDVHTDTASAHRYHRGYFLQRQEGHALEEHAQLRVFLHQLLVHVGVFGAAGHEHRHPIDTVLAVVGRAGHRTVFGVFVAVVIFEYAEPCHQVQQLVEGLVVRRIMLLRIHRVQLLVRVVLAYLEEIAGQHVQQQVE